MASQEEVVTAVPIIALAVASYPSLKHEPIAAAPLELIAVT